MTNKLPNRTSLRLRKSLPVILLLAWLFSVFETGFAQENDDQTTPKPTKQAAAEEQAQKNAEVRRKARQTLEEARKRLEGYDSIRADIVETVLLGSRRYQAKGEYVQVRGNKVRLSFQVSIKGADGKPLQGSLLQVSNGEVMHSSYQVGDDLQVSRRDVVQIMDTIEKYPYLGIDLVKARLGLGGLPALLSSLETSLAFDDYQVETINEKQFLKIAGGWTPQLIAQMKPPGSPEDTPLPAYIPDRVHVYFDEENYFPRRVLYLKQVGEGFQPMLTLDFVNIRQNVAVSADDFLFYPPEGAVSQDITQSIIQGIIQAHNQSQQSKSPDSANSKTPDENSGK
ncbi:MAG: hypothetical protein HUJ26_03570 [Planctomycetaceae bacterium]|nr:hypothetical protein [Planctomycetaceae bacterium]